MTLQLTSGAQRLHCLSADVATSGLMCDQREPLFRESPTRWYELTIRRDRVRHARRLMLIRQTLYEMACQAARRLAARVKLQLRAGPRPG